MRDAPDSPVPDDRRAEGQTVPPHHVVVVGAGFGGLEAVRRLRGSAARITLIDQRNHHLFQPLLYQVATTILSTSEIAWPIRGLMAARKDVTTLLARVDGVDPDRRTVQIDGGTRIAYDTLILATGARHAYFGHDEWEAFAPGLKSLEDATTIRRRLLLAFEQAERATDPAEIRALLTFAVIGAGPTGVELAGIIADLARVSLWSSFRRIDTRQARILLIEAGPRVLPAFPETLSAYAAGALAARGVELRFGVPVSDCQARSVTIGTDVIPCRTAIWAAGVAASPAAVWLGVTPDRAGRVPVLGDLTLDGRPEVFVIGDTAALRMADGNPVPGIAPAAKQQGAHVARVIRARLSGDPAPAAFRYRHLGNFATIGNGAGVVQIGRLHFRGRLAWWLWGAAHIFFLIGTRSRVIVAWNWLWIYACGQHSARLITQGSGAGNDAQRDR